MTNGFYPDSESGSSLAPAFFSIVYLLEWASSVQGWFWTTSVCAVRR